MSKSNLVTHNLLHNGRKVYITTEKLTRIDEKLSLGHFYEHKLLGYITRKCRSGVFLDIGGNCGQHAVYFALFCPSTLVYCIEPLPDHVNLIRKNVSDNLLQDKVRVIPVAAGSDTSAVRVTTNAVNFDSHFSAISMPLDDIVTGPVSIIKIDVEGMELDVIRGLSKTIKKDHPLIFVECLNEDSIKTTTDLLEPYGYFRNSEPFHNTMYEFFIDDIIS